MIADHNLIGLLIRASLYMYVFCNLSHKDWHLSLELPLHVHCLSFGGFRCIFSLSGSLYWAMRLYFQSSVWLYGVDTSKQEPVSRTNKLLQSSCYIQQKSCTRGRRMSDGGCHVSAQLQQRRTGFSICYTEYGGVGILECLKVLNAMEN